MYIGNLRRENKLKSLRQHHFLSPDCDNSGHLLNKDVFVQFVGTKVYNDKDILKECVN